MKKNEKMNTGGCGESEFSDDAVRREQRREECPEIKQEPEKQDEK